MVIDNTFFSVERNINSVNIPKEILPAKNSSIFEKSLADLYENNKPFIKAYLKPLKAGIASINSEKSHIIIQTNQLYGYCTNEAQLILAYGKNIHSPRFLKKVEEFCMHIKYHPLHVKYGIISKNKRKSSLITTTSVKNNKLPSIKLESNISKTMKMLKANTCSLTLPSFKFLPPINGSKNIHNLLPFESNIDHVLSTIPTGSISKEEYNYFVSTDSLRESNNNILMELYKLQYINDQGLKSQHKKSLLALCGYDTMCTSSPFSTNITGFLSDHHISLQSHNLKFVNMNVDRHILDPQLVIHNVNGSSVLSVSVAHPWFKWMMKYELIMNELLNFIAKETYYRLKTYESMALVSNALNHYKPNSLVHNNNNSIPMYENSNNVGYGLYSYANKNDK